MTTTQVAVQPVPYLHFHGIAIEAIEFYKKALAAKLISKATIGDMPQCDDQSHNPMANEDPNLIMNAVVELPGGGQFYLMDRPSFMPFDKIGGVTVSLSYPTVEEGEKVFRALSDGGQVTMDWSPTFWAEMFGMVTDKFGVPWIINGNLK